MTLCHSFLIQGPIIKRYIVFSQPLSNLYLLKLLHYTQDIITGIFYKTERKTLCQINILDCATLLNTDICIFYFTLSFDTVIHASGIIVKYPLVSCKKNLRREINSREKIKSLGSQKKSL